MERDNLKAHVDKMRQDFEEKTTRLQKENEKLRQENAKLSREQSRMNQHITDLRQATKQGMTRSTQCQQKMKSYAKKWKISKAW